MTVLPEIWDNASYFMVVWYNIFVLNICTEICELNPILNNSIWWGFICTIYLWRFFFFFVSFFNWKQCRKLCIVSSIMQQASGQPWIIRHFNSENKLNFVTNDKADGKVWIAAFNFVLKSENNKIIEMKSVFLSSGMKARIQDPLNQFKWQFNNCWLCDYNMRYRYWNCNPIVLYRFFGCINVVTVPTCNLRYKY